MWEYVKGSEADFEGAPEWALYVDTTIPCKDKEDRPLWFTENYEIGGRFVKKGQTNIYKYDGCNAESYIIAERRKVDDLQSRTNDVHLQQAFDTVQRPAHYNQSGIECVIAERGTRYGDFKDGAAIMQQLKDVMKAAPKWEALKPSQKEALEMIQHKIGRILNGDPDYDDNWKDIAGYATLIVKELQ